MAASILQVLTANRLRDGDVVYWRAGAWVEAFAEAEIFPDKPQADAALARAGEDVAARRVVNPYLFPVRVEDGRPRAVEEREIVRSEGPSVRRDLGKQAHV
jgi:sulfite reductase (NADPH) hemoprotein beta-component